MEKRNKLIIIKLQGGLGNQMFQYALASILAKKNNADLLLDNCLFDQHKKILGYTPRQFELAVFSNSFLIAKERDILFFKQLSVFNKIKRELNFNYPKIYCETSFGFNQKIFLIKKPVYLRGYFQSYRYFIDHENFINGLFTFPVEKLDCINKQLLVVIKNTNTIAIHIRRGDYVNDAATQQFHGNCSLDYYLNAISLLAAIEKEFSLFFFSDDSDWVKDQFGDLPYPKQFIDHNRNEHSWKDMLLMSACNHNIIANSSFSWWAAWLNVNPNKKVIAPKKWFAKPEEEINTSDLIPPEWTRL